MRGDERALDLTEAKYLVTTLNASSLLFVRCLRTTVRPKPDVGPAKESVDMIGFERRADKLGAL